MKASQFFICFMMSVIVSGCSVLGIRSEEQPKYKVILQEKDKEIREYQPYIIAKTTVSGDFEEAQQKGFRILAGYIFGKNKSKKKIDMTSPAIQGSEDSSEKIAMTAPVVMSSQDQVWTMTFAMPSKYSLKTLPVPEDKRVLLEKVPSQLIAAHVFSGFWSEDKNKKKGVELLNWLETMGKYKVMSKPMFAGYNPPWTIPFLRRNEILIQIKSLK